MKISTSIRPREDDTVVVEFGKGNSLVFARDEAGELTCDVTDEADVARLLRNENFYPNDPADFQSAEQLIGLAGVAQAADGLAQSAAGVDDDDDGDEPVDMNALPVEGKSAADPVADVQAAEAAPAPAPAPVSRRRSS